MAIFDDRTLKPKRSAFWVFAPIVTIFIAIILWVNFRSDTGFSWTLFLIFTGALALLLIIWKVVSHLRSSSSEVREYEKEMKKLGRR